MRPGLEVRVGDAQVVKGAHLEQSQSIPILRGLKQREITRILFAKITELVSKETAELRLWGSETQRFGFLNGVGKVN